MSSQYQLVKRVKEYNPNADEKLLVKAYYFSKKAHSDQLRASGDPYFSHPLAVTNILIDLKLDVPSIITGLLHDTVEDTFVTIDLVRKEFGEEIANLVDGVTRLNKIKMQPENLRYAEDFRKFFLAFSEDIRILLVKIADRLHNLRTLEHIKSKTKRLKKAHETLEVYAPLTERIGMHIIKDEMQDISFSEIYPEVRGSIIQRLDYLREKGDDNIVKKIINEIERIISAKDISCDIQGREKKPYSIWTKMQKKNISFEQLSDIIAFRIITKNVDECYHVLGVIHQHFHMIPESFKDYISTPKNNGYMSLHTTVIGPEKQKIEIQIRSREMHDIAEYGIAAHWCYKNGFDIKGDIKNYQWIRDLVQSLKEADSSEEFFDNTKIEMYQDQVFCFSPKGDILALPVGATPVDFAYAIHSEIGHNCMGAKINGVIAPLRSILNNGDQVEVICSKNQVPSESWEEFVVTSKAKAHIKKFVRTIKREQYLLDGEERLSKYFSNRACVFNEQVVKAALPIFAKTKNEDLFVAVGEGKISESQIFQTCYPNYVEIKKNKKIFGFFNKKRRNKKQQIRKNKDYQCPIKGIIPDMPITYSDCCNPIPGDKIIGMIDSFRGMHIHRKNCSQISAKQRDHISLNWIPVPLIKQLFTARLKIVSANEYGVVAEITNVINNAATEIDNLKIIARSDDYLELTLDVKVNNAKALFNLKAALRAAKIIFSVERPV